MNYSTSHHVKRLLAKFTTMQAEYIQDELSLQRLNLTPLDTLELLYDLEDFFQIEFPDTLFQSELDNEFHRVEHLIDLVETQVKKKKAA